MMKKDFEVFNKLSPKSIEILKSINPKYKNVSKVSIYDIVVAISTVDPSLMELVKDLKLNSKIEKKTIDLNNWLIDAYREAYASDSEVVDAYHLVLAFLLQIDKDVYFKIKKKYPNQYKFAEVIGLKPYYEDFSKSYKHDDYVFVDREREMTKLIVNLTASNPKPILLLGSKGVGKTTLVKELAKRIDKKNVPEDLKNAKIIRVRYNLLFNVIPSDTNVPFQVLFSHILSSIASTNTTKNSKLILFIDDIKFKNNYFISFEDGNNSNLLIIGAVDEIPNKVWENMDNPINNSWEIIEFEDMKSDDYKKILVEHIKRSNNLSDFDYTYEAIAKLIEYYKDNFMSESLPGIAIHSLELIGLYKKLQKKQKKKAAKVNARSNKENNLQIRGSNSVLQEVSIKTNKKVKDCSNDVLITSFDVEAYFGIQKSKADDNNNDTYKVDVFKIEKYLKSTVIGQDEAIDALARSLRISSMKLLSTSRPVGTFLFLGPTGVGKTYMAKQLAGVLFGFKDNDSTKPKNFLRIDMSEYSEKHTVSKLFGAPPGYIGYDDSSVLSDFVIENPRSVILFDEIDKAHPNVLNSLLHIMEEGEFRANTGEIISFTETIIIMTSNHGAELINKSTVGFNESNINKNYEEIKVELLENLKRVVKPEFLNRFDEIIVFRSLSFDDLLKILDVILQPIIQRMSVNGINLIISDKAKRLIIENSNETEYGAREIRRTLNRDLIDPISHIIYKNKNVKEIRIATKNKNLKFTYK